jgi:hypothetical protein
MLRLRVLVVVAGDGRRRRTRAPFSSTAGRPPDASTASCTRQVDHGSASRDHGSKERERRGEERADRRRRMKEIPVMLARGRIES